jgi:DNA-nicking Smr family endonuclease
MVDPEDSFSEPVVVPVDGVLDLHAFSPRDIASVVEAYLEAASGAGLPEVRLIHGRGMGVERRRVRILLECHPLVAACADAPPERGGWGATLVRLRTEVPLPPSPQPICQAGGDGRP